MAITIGSNFKVSTNLPIDERMVFQTIAERDAIPNNVRYDGLITYVKDDRKGYQLRGGITNTDWVNANLILPEEIGAYDKEQVDDLITAKLTDKAYVDAHIADTVKHITPAERTGWNNKLDKAGNIAQDVSLKQLTVHGNILPGKDNLNIGSPTQRFKSIYVDEAYLSTNTLYIGNTPILGTEMDTVQIKADPDQSIAMKTSAGGTTSILSDRAIDIATSGMNSSVTIQTTGVNSQTNIAATARVSLDAPEINLTGNANVTGDLTARNLNITGDFIVGGTLTTVNATNLEISDNIIDINKGETGQGVAEGLAGIKIDRGDLNDVLLVFDEVDDKFKVGDSANLLALATEKYVYDNRYIHPAGTNPHGTTKADVGLGNVTNESKATMFASPSFTGTPVVPTAADNNNTTQIATTAFVMRESAKKANASHGVHIPAPETANARKFLRNDNSWQELPVASTANTGLVKLNDAVNSDSLTEAATSHAVKVTYDLANSKASTALVTPTAHGLMSKEDKSKLDDIAPNANNYVHPSVHPASMITESATKRFITDIERNTWNAKADKIYLDSTFLKLAGGTLAGSLVTSVVTRDSRLTTGNTQVFNATSNTVILGNPVSNLQLESKANPVVHVNGTNYTMYHTGFKPSPADIGASASNHLHDDRYLKLVGGTVSGPLTVLGTAASESFKVRGIQGVNETGTTNDALYLNYNTDKPVYINGTNKVYHEGFRPTPESIGAAPAHDHPYLPLVGGSLTGHIYLPGKGYISATNVDENATIRMTADNNAFMMGLDNIFNSRRGWIQVRHRDNSYATSYGVLALNPLGGNVTVNNGVVYHTNNKPSKTDVGLSNVGNYAIATTAEAQAGTSNTTYMTPLRVKEAVSILAPADHNHDNIYLKLSGGIVTGTIERYSNNKDFDLIKFGHAPDDVTASWIIAYKGATSDADGNEMQIKSTTGTIYEFDHLGNLEFVNGANRYKYYNQNFKPSKTDVGLSNVDNTSDASKPISTSTQTALNNKVDKVTGKQLSTEDYTTAEKTKLAGIATNANNYVHPANHPASVITQDANNRFTTDAEKSTWNAKETPSGAQTKATKALTDAKAYSDTNLVEAKAYTDSKVGEILDAAPEALDTLKELSAALGNDPNFAGTVTTQIGLKADKTYVDATFETKHTHPYLPLEGGTLTGNLFVKNLISATGLTGASKQLICGSGTTIYVGNPTTPMDIESSTTPTVRVGGNNYKMYHTGNKPTKADIGLDNVDNTTDLNKPVSTATQTALNLKATKANPAFTGTLTIDNESMMFSDVSITPDGGKDTVLRQMQSANWSEIRVTDGVETSSGIIVRFSPDTGTTWKDVFKAIGSELSYKGNKIYHSGNKPTKADVGLSNVDNTSDANKPISTATQTALNGKANSSHEHSVVGTANIKIYPENNNEINFGGNHDGGNTIYFGYKEKDSKPIPATFVFGGTGTATLKAGNVQIGGNNVYHTGRKPTLTELGAASTAVATTSANGLMSKEDKVKLDKIGDIVTLTKTLTLTQEWQDIGIEGTTLETGSYVLQISGMDTGTGIWHESFTGFMSWYSGTTNNATADEVLLHKAGHASDRHIYIRTIRQVSPGKLKLQICCSHTLTASPFTFKFRKLI